MTQFCNLIGGTLAEPPEVNGLNPPMLPGSFLPCTKRGNEPGDEATHTSPVEQVVRKVLYETNSPSGDWQWECYLGHSEALTL